MRWYYLGILLFGLVSGCASERDRLAPIVIPNVHVGVCALSPSHRYVIAHIYDPNDDGYKRGYESQIIDLTTTKAITIPLWERDPITGEPAAVVIDLPNESYTEGCYNAWSADSRSYYFLDWETVGPRQAGPGPIRKITLP
ncbi:hypothetical protein [Herpetosiphon giganteus]|uniref:hypothetical protein n=1 Tax=Herpetosiphon giganteus TaxID=2029754 RepID=UPI001958940A|nr:hypothetical protein [Herpetosiphon giganteus]MBM7845682.1 hypothetical protein [Herpetosiphon giganteus]